MYTIEQQIRGALRHGTDWLVITDHGHASHEAHSVEATAADIAAGKDAFVTSSPDTVVQGFRGARPDLVAELPRLLAGDGSEEVAERHAAPGTFVLVPPDVEGDRPGRCPKCGMKLLATEAAPIAYACPMHPDVMSDVPGRCPTCGMKLVPDDGAAIPEGHGHGSHHDHGHDQTQCAAANHQDPAATQSRAARCVLQPAAPAEPQIPAPVKPQLTAEEQMALYEKELKETDWGHQPC